MEDRNMTIEEYVRYETEKAFRNDIVYNDALTSELEFSSEPTLINDIKITKMEIPVHQRNTKFVNNLPSYWGKYVNIVKNSKDISTVSYVDLYNHLKSYKQHAIKTLSKMNQTSGNADPLAYIAQATQSTYSPSQYVPLPPQYTPAPQQAPQALGNKKNAATGSQGKVVTCYNCHGQGHVAKECKEKKRAKDSQWFKDKALLMEAKEKGVILDEEAEAFLADMECIAPYAEPLSITTTTAFEVIYEDAYDFDVDEAPHASAAFIANLMQTGPSTGHGTKIHRGEQLDSNVDLVIDDHDNTIPYHQYQLNNEVESVPTDVSSVIPGGISMITILDDLRSQLVGHIKDVGNKMHKAFLLLGESSHWQYKFPLPVEGVPTASGMEIPLPRVCTAMMKKLPVKENWQKQVGDLSTHTTKYTSPALTQKVFANMRRVGVVSAADDVVLSVDEEPSIPSPTPPTLPPQPSHDIPSTSQVQPTPPQSPQVSKDVAVEKSADVEDNADIQERTAESQAEIYKIGMDNDNKVLSMQQEESEPIEIQEVVDVVTTAKIITKLLLLAKEDNVVKRYQAIKRKPQTEAQERKNIMIYLKNVAGFKMDYFKGMPYDDIRLVFEKYFDSNVAFLQKKNKQMDEEDSRALKRLNESQEGKAA
nr:hypothetical protein [Tanacetum cinerariifolium]